MNMGVPQFVALLGLAGLLGGCAFNYVAADGARHIVGLVHAVLPPQGTGPLPAESVRTQAVGLSFTRSDVATTLALGYTDTTRAFVRENTCVAWPLAAAAPAAFFSAVLPAPVFIGWTFLELSR